jgi:hypothetical protein
LFFVFSNDKPKFFWSFLFWLGVMFLVPMLFSSPQFIITSYGEWFSALAEKNIANVNAADPSLMQDISMMGFLRRSFGFPSSYNIHVIIAGMAVVLLPLLRFGQFGSRNFRLSYLAIVLLSTVIFSTSAESPTYVIAVAGVAIWYTIAEKTWWTTTLLLLTLIVTCLSGTDFFPAYLRDHFISPYSLKALPCVLIWIVLIISVSFKKFYAIKNTLPTHETRKHYIASLQ